MFRLRRRTETPSSPTAQRGAVGSARVWDERTRADRAGLPGPRSSPQGAPLESTLSPLELAGLVRAVVQTTLNARLPDCRPERRAALAQELEQRLLDVFEARARHPPEPPADAPAPAAAAPAEGVAAPAPVASGPPAPPPLIEPRARLLHLALEDRLGHLGSPLASRADLRDRLVALALARLASATAEPGASSDDLNGLDVLQRRAAKLEQALAEARAALSYVARLEHVDAGLASIYRDVQGLAPQDPRRALKSAALECIFRANLALQKPGVEPV